jgi:hypothetical protein
MRAYRRGLQEVQQVLLGVLPLLLELAPPLDRVVDHHVEVDRVLFDRNLGFGVVDELQLLHFVREVQSLLVFYLGQSRPALFALFISRTSPSM